MDQLMNVIELRGCLSETKAQVIFPKDGGAKIALDTSEQDEDAAYLLRKHMKGCLLKVTFEVLERGGKRAEVAE